MNRGIYNKKLHTFFSSIAINAFLIQEETTDGTRQPLGEFIEVEVNIFLHPSLWRQYIQARISYDRAQGLSSPLYAHLQLANVRPNSDRIVDFVYQDHIEALKACFETGLYRVDDLYLDGSYDYQSPLNVRTVTSS